MMMKMRADGRGFTLVEVMVALMVVAIALPALLKALYQQIDGTAYLRDKSLAQWVASNRMAEVRLQVDRNGTLFRGERTGQDTMASQEWYWEMTSEETAVADFYRLEIRVGLEDFEEREPLYTLVGFLSAASFGDVGR
jgi:general secretion pathway protein I